MSANTPTANTRLFYPEQYLLGPGRALEQPSDVWHHIIRYDAEAGLTRLAVNNLKAKKRAERTLTIDDRSLVVAVDGLGHGGVGNPSTKSAYGVYFGKASPHNRGAILPEGLNKSEEVALLSAAYMALDYIHAQLLPDLRRDERGNAVAGSGSLRRVIIVTDAEYLVRCMSEYVWVWEGSGYRESGGKAVTHTNEIWDMSELIQTFEEMGVEVRFWQMWRGSVKEARRLAGEALASWKEDQEAGKELCAEESGNRGRQVS